jgi:hypothetical protein
MHGMHDTTYDTSIGASLKRQRKRRKWDFCIIILWETHFIYRMKGCVEEIPFSQQTPPGRHPFHILDHMFISQHSLLINLSSVYCNPKTPSKNPMRKIEKYYNNMPSKTPLKTQWEKYKEKPYDICSHLYLYCLIKYLIWEILGKTHKGKKSIISVIERSLTSYN